MKGVSIASKKDQLSIQFISGKAVQISLYREDVWINPCISNQSVDAVNYKHTVDDQVQEVSYGDVTVRHDRDTNGLEVISGDQRLSVLKMSLYEKEINGDRVLGSETVFEAEFDESFYGLGQHQNDVLDYSGESVHVWHDYKAKGGEVIGIPFLVSSKGYGIVMNTMGQSTVIPGRNNKTTWTCDCVHDLSFYLIMTDDFEELYREYRSLTGVTPMPLKASLGYIQCKQRYRDQAEITDVARKYRDKGYPIDMLVVDWFYWKTLGDMSMDSRDWPAPEKMTAEFLALGIDTMISLWPRFMKESTNYDFLESKGWFMKDEDGSTVYGTSEDRRGALIDTTDSECGKWYWETVRDNLGSKGFRAWWTDENEPDLWPYDFFFAAGKGYEVFNLYPYTHTEAIYKGHRNTYDQRCTILSRSAYLGAQKFGTQFWSSDIYPTWGVLKKQIPAAINFCASGMGYWSSDIGGWQALPDYDGRSNEGVNELLIETQGQSDGVVGTKDYAELYIRWFQFSVFCPILRAHGTRDENEIWSFGEVAEKILHEQLKLRYSLMPYLYSMAYKLHSVGMPILRGLFMAFPQDLKARSVKDQFIFGDSFLVAPVLVPGATQREVYLPEGCDWYEWYTGERHQGGKTVNVAVTLDSIPVYIRENSLIPIGEEVRNTKEVQKITWKFFGRETGEFTLYADDGRSYEYEKGDFCLSQIHYKEGKLFMDGRTCDAFVEVVR